MNSAPTGEALATRCGARSGQDVQGVQDKMTHNNVARLVAAVTAMMGMTGVMTQGRGAIWTGTGTTVAATRTAKWSTRTGSNRLKIASDRMPIRDQGQTKATKEQSTHG